MLFLPLYFSLGPYEILVSNVLNPTLTCDLLSITPVHFACDNSFWRGLLALMIAVCAFVVLLLTAHCFWNSHSKITRFFSFFFLITGSLPLIFAFIKEGSFLTFTLAALGWGSALAFIPALLFLILPKLSSDYYEFVSDHPSHMNSDLLIQALILFWGILLGAIAGCCSLLFHALFKNKLSESELLFHTDTALTTF